VDEEGKARPSGAQASHLLGAAARADGLVDVPPRSSFAPGTLVRVLRWD
jgi:molybdopterin biosynthesis enzyme